MARQRSTWEVDSGAVDNDVATASKSADGSGRRHYMSGIFAGYDDFNATGELTVTLGSGRTFRIPVGADGVYVAFAFPLQGDAGAAISAALSASGTGGVDGRVGITGYTAA